MPVMQEDMLKSWKYDFFILGHLLELLELVDWCVCNPKNYPFCVSIRLCLLFGTGEQF